MSATEPKPIKITIADMRTPRWLRLTVGMTVGLFGPIALGIATGSVAMQWAGFIMGALMFIGLAQRSGSDDRTFSSADEAKAYIDKLTSSQA